MKKKILLVGAGGTLGRAIAEELQADHELVRVARTQGDHHVDVTRDDSVQALFASVGRVDAIVAATGHPHFGPLTDTTAAQFALGLDDKLLGQVRLALIGQHHLNDGGSITLTTGIVSQESIHGGSNATTINTAIEGFVRAAALELPRGMRINAVSPTVLEESWNDYGQYFPGFVPVPARAAALAYRRSIGGIQTGRTYTVW